ARTLVPLFAATLFASSLLMFAVEPIVAKTVLPILGGTPMVWNTCVLFFQVLLLGGYAFAHGATAWFGRRGRAVAFTIVLAPAIVEPTLPLRSQNVVWAIAYGGFVAAACVTMLVGWRRRRSEATHVPLARQQAPALPLTWQKRASWIALAFVPSSLMLAVTTY